MIGKFKYTGNLYEMQYQLARACIFFVFFVLLRFLIFGHRSSTNLEQDVMTLGGKKVEPGHKSM